MPDMTGIGPYLLQHIVECEIEFMLMNAELELIEQQLEDQRWDAINVLGDRFVAASIDYLALYPEVMDPNYVREANPTQEKKDMERLIIEAAVALGELLREEEMHPFFRALDREIFGMADADSDTDSGFGSTV